MRILTIALALLLPAAARAEHLITARQQPITDEKAVFATVESRNIVPARTRIGGTLADLSVRAGDEVRRGQTIAIVGDEKLQLQLRSLDAQIGGLRATLAEAEVTFNRFDALAKSGAVSRQQYDQARTALDVAQSSLNARIAERAVVAQQMSEGAVLAPTAGRVLEVPVTRGTVVLPGEPVARIAEGDFVLRLDVPERHAMLLHDGDRVRLNGADVGLKGPVFGKITLIYPQIQQGRIVADATASDIGSYFVGRRIQVWISAGERMSFVIPQDYIDTRFGLSFVKRRTPDGQVEEIPVQRGRDMPTQAMPDGVEILSGLQPGDELVGP